MSLYLVTGVNGFIGSHVARRLLAMDHRVRGIVRRRSDLSFIEGLDIDLHIGDICDRSSLAAPMAGVDIVIHVAGLASDWGPYREFHRVNVDGTRNTAETAHRAGVRRFIHIGTTAVHGFGGFSDLTESAPMAHTPFPYCESKKAAERYLFDLDPTVDMEVVSIRPGNVFGARDHTFIQKYLDAMVAGQLGYVSRGRCLTAPTYVENLVDAIVAASTAAGAAGEAFFITDGLRITWREFTEKFADALGLPPPKLSVPFRLAYVAASLSELLYQLLNKSSPPLLTRYRVCNGGRDYHFSIDKARQVLRYRPAVNLDEAVLRTVRWYRNRPTTGPSES